MNFIQFLFALIAQFTQMDSAKRAGLENQAEKWAEENKDHKFWGKLLKYQNEWYVQVALCFVLIFSVKSIARWMTEPTRSNDEDDEFEDELDDEDAYNAFVQERNRSKQKMSLKF